MDTRVCRVYGKKDIRVETETVAEPGAGEVLVAVAAGGICGSDLHYYHDGGFGPIRVQQPMILGHEASGVIRAVGAGVTDLAVGDRVALNPSMPCGECSYCAEGLPTHCLNMRFRGSAMRMPHEQGLFRDRLVIPAKQCVKVAPEVDLGELACSEPLSVCLHARTMAGDLQGKRVLVTGAGPIGALCAAVARDGGASEIVVTDLQDYALGAAEKMGATRVINVGLHSAEMERYTADKGHFDTVFECSAAGPAIRTAIAAVRPQGKIVQVGVTGDLALPINMLVGKEITYQGTQRFQAEFFDAVEAIAERRIDVRPIITQTMPLADAVAAFDLAGDRTQAVKVHLTFEG
ncbi:L-idonate 5-dehydrogenase [Tropicibacter naphthalenivorans]|uniref:L-idonate 5-dehydrogenase n=1 Tax=Tropicibacter naphthalenivorans TaxID=441103 RepID=A0A0P1GKG9_9RHOB|nr:L-idonate 5-dehydrogenase [Tropicibacter naphthalenivorans]CUH75869.1 L-idonate 5-dehydrogenase [Tropicibacter naphthalenivorans]SMC41707.1 L-idonate 5-dehydrogenase [Tropicibacter naphthalenivorans]